MILFIILEISHMIWSNKMELPWPKLFISSVLIGLSVFIHGFLTHALIIAFGCTTVFYFHRNRKSADLIFHTFTIWITILTSYSLIITFSPLAGFEPTSPLFSGYTSPAERFSHPFIKQNSFGFFGERGVYGLTSIALIFSIIYSHKTQSKIYYLSSILLFTQLINIYWLTGSGRAGFVLPLFFIIVLGIKKYLTESLIPLVVFSPLITWIGLFTLKDVSALTPIIETLNTIMSNRLALYLDTIQILISNSQSIVGWGPTPWGDYSHAELGIKSSIGTYGQVLTRPHNFLFEVLIQYGLMVGFLLIYVCWQITKETVKEVREPTSSTQFALVIVLAGTIFTGIFVGGKVGPYPVNDAQMILWWIGFGAFLPSRIS
jgi:hypothetical protein